MDLEYISQFENEKLENRLAKGENIPAIEDLLNQDSAILERLQGLRKEGGLDFGGQVSHKQLRKIFPLVCANVNDLLHKFDSDIPKYKYHGPFKSKLEGAFVFSAKYVLAGFSGLCFVNYFTIEDTLLESRCLETAIITAIASGMVVLIENPLKKIIKFNNQSLFVFNTRLEKERVVLDNDFRCNLIATIAHEYVHALQCRSGFGDSKYSVFWEGHARGVARQVAQGFFKREDNEAFLFKSLDFRVGELRSAYLWLCQRFDKYPIESLLRIQSKKDEFEAKTLLKTKKPSPYAIGHTLFSIYEELLGKDIYRQLIHGDFQFPD